MHKDPRLNEARSRLKSCRDPSLSVRFSAFLRGGAWQSRVAAFMSYLPSCPSLPFPARLPPFALLRGTHPANLSRGERAMQSKAPPPGLPERHFWGLEQPTFDPTLPAFCGTYSHI